MEQQEIEEEAMLRRSQLLNNNNNFVDGSNTGERKSNTELHALLDELASEAATLASRRHSPSSSSTSSPTSDEGFVFTGLLRRRRSHYGLVGTTKYVANVILVNLFGFGIVACVLHPLRMAVTQVRHHQWRGWKNVLRPGHRSSIVPSVFDYQMMKLLNYGVRRWMYDSIGRPFDRKRKRKQQQRKVKVNNKAEGKDKKFDIDIEMGMGSSDGLLIGEEEDDEILNGTNETTDARDKKGKEKEQDADDTPDSNNSQNENANNEEEEDEEDLTFKDLLKSIGFFGVTKAIALSATAVVGVVHLPIATVTHRLSLQPQAYSGVIDCVRRIAADEGWRGFYRGAGWYMLWMSDLVFIHDTWSGVGVAS